MDIYLQVTDDENRTLTLDGDLDLLDRLLATLKNERGLPSIDMQQPVTTPQAQGVQHDD